MQVWGQQEKALYDFQIISVLIKLIIYRFIHDNYKISWANLFQSILLLSFLLSRWLTIFLIIAYFLWQVKRFHQSNRKKKASLVGICLAHTLTSKQNKYIKAGECIEVENNENKKLNTSSIQPVMSLIAVRFSHMLRNSFEKTSIVLLASFLSRRDRSKFFNYFSSLSCVSLPLFSPWVLTYTQICSSDIRSKNGRAVHLPPKTLFIPSFISAIGLLLFLSSLKMIPTTFVLIT